MTRPVTIHTEADRQRVQGLIAALDLSKPWAITVERPKKRRTLSQGALYFKWCGIIADETGNTKEDVHEALKVQFVPAREITFGNGLRAPVHSTANLETAAMSEYMDKVYAFVTSELGILLPLPEEMLLR